MIDRTKFKWPTGSDAQARKLYDALCDLTDEGMTRGSYFSPEVIFHKAGWPVDDETVKIDSSERDLLDTMVDCDLARRVSITVPPQGTYSESTLFGYEAI